MTKTFIIICIAIVLLQGGLGVLRWLKKNNAGPFWKTVFRCLALVAMTIVVVTRIPAVRERMGLAIAPVVFDLGIRNCCFLLDFLMATSLIRMLIEQFLLHQPYTKREWIVSGLLCGMIGVLSVSFLL
ncbi:MAG: hypothetical protein J5851_01705 [Oscillospiraceae bacterium]|nr:hypothetical protein [Oscillospiraceae bacterium]